MGRVISFPAQKHRVSRVRGRTRRVEAMNKGRKTKITGDLPETIEEAVKAGKSVTTQVTTTAITVSDPKPTRVKKARKAKPIIVEDSIVESIMSLPFTEGSFRFIKCSRQKATAIQQRIYKINKDNAAGWQIATRYNYKQGGLITWRMA